MYAILEHGSKQYRVAPGDMLEVERIESEPGKDFNFSRVLLVSNGDKISVGAPALDNAVVIADVVEHIRGPKKVAFKMKRRKGYHRTVGHRQALTRVKVKDIRL